MLSTISENLIIRANTADNHRSDDSSFQEPCFSNGHIVRHQGEMVPNELYGVKLADFKHFFERSIGSASPTNLYLCKSENVTKSTNKEDRQINKNMEENANKNKLIEQVRDRLDTVMCNWVNEVVEFLNKNSIDRIHDLLQYETRFKDKIIDETFWNLMIKRTRYFDSEVTFNSGDWCEIIVANVIIKTLAEANKSLCDIFKYSQSPTPEEIISLIRQVVELVKSKHLSPVKLNEKIESAVYIYWYMMKNKKELLSESSDSSLLVIANFLEPIVNISVKGLIQSFIYKNPVTRMADPVHNDSLYDGNTIKISRLDSMHSSLFLEQNLLFGEEFEYAIPEESNYSLNECFSKLAQKWRKKLSLKAEELNVEFNCEENKGEMTIKFGKEFKIKIFRDGDNLEINTVPYGFNQNFTTDGEEKKSAYWFIQNFVCSVADELGLKGVSGHKHIDVKNSITGSAEFISRVIIDSQAKSFFPVLLNRSNSKEYFKFDDCKHFHKNGNPFPKATEYLVDAINTQLKSGDCCLLNTDFQRTVEFIDMLRETFNYFDDKYVVCNLQHINAKNQPNSIDTPPSTTLEFRVMQCPRSGEETRLINMMFIDWFSSLYKNQLNHTTLEHPHLAPKYYSDNPNIAIQHFKSFLKKIESRITEEACEKLIHCIT